MHNVPGLYQQPGGAVGPSGFHGGDYTPFLFGRHYFPPLRCEQFKSLNQGIALVPELPVDLRDH